MSRRGIGLLRVHVPVRGRLVWGIGPDDYGPANVYVTQQAPATIGLPLQQTVRYVKTDNFRLFPASEAQYADIRQPLAYAYLGYVTGLQEHITIIEGNWPATATKVTDTLEVLISQRLAEAGHQIGRRHPPGQRARLLPAGASRQMCDRRGTVATNPSVEFWFYPKAFEDVSSRRELPLGCPGRS